ncbi:hypothetical protein ACIQD3_09460 [Peribacillus loiseleuriae]|uniref:hypothetical protein n=1 Tax=Peribacillus loiseleuriae TaxID=1679170 RepID=UPI003811DCA9
MEIERVFNEQSNTTFEDIFKIIIEEKIDALVSEHYYQSKVNTATSHVEGKKIS